MAERLEDPVEQDALRQEKARSNPDGAALLRVVSRKSARGDEVVWTEEVKGQRSRQNVSAETIVGDGTDEATAGEDRGADIPISRT
jgi:hypothetical protein